MTNAVRAGRAPAGTTTSDGAAGRSRRPGPGTRVTGWLVLAVAGFLLPTLLGGSTRIYTTCVLVAIFAMMSYGADVVLSYLGEVSLGHTLFWAAGAYATAYFTVKSGWGPLPSLLVSLAIAALLALLVGLATLRTREFVFSLVTYATAIIGLTVVSNVGGLGGSDGIVGVPLLTLPAIGGSYVARTDVDIWPIAYVLLVVVIFFIARFRRSRLGANALMTQMNPGLATTMGVDVRRTRVLVFVVSAPISALAGWLYAFQRSYVSPDLLSASFLLFMLTAVILPGRRQLLGPLIGAALITAQQQLASFGGDVDKIVLGGVLALVLLVSPNGFAGLGRLLVRRRHPAAEASPAATAAADE
ncbi:branched-chain amino acid ABC transporter permease [Amycolatopsis carbonis]|uniref:Branched-chain amino acid ABC transporter permease n=1 Tax=Amycolatopsis carbonis TaxID=715471 RepID=A0A9Y2IC22_9PSEU|nr:branched-chain amino acid ABC transporter permease [Amycolatopsis sp. 2-15]WIX77317.1 branched-chain amino acid ABC transporter permease [Amycolatopsis sp. 2-15]